MVEERRGTDGTDSVPSHINGGRNGWRDSALLPNSAIHHPQTSTGKFCRGKVSPLSHLHLNKFHFFLLRIEMVFEENRFCIVFFKKSFRLECKGAVSSNCAVKRAPCGERGDQEE